MKKKDTSEVINQEKLSLQLYVSGMSPKSLEAIKNINKLLKEYPDGFFELEIIDIYKSPELAAEHSIIFSPSLIKLFPYPKKVLIGTLTDKEKVIKALGITFNGKE